MKVFLLFIFLVLAYILPSRAASLLDFTLNLGPSITQGGNNDKLGKPNLAAGITQVFSFNDSYYGKDISRNRMAAIFQIGLGL